MNEGISHSYQRACTTPSSTNILLPYLCELSKECKTIVELGVGEIVTTWAFLQGLLENGATEKRLVSVDLWTHPNMESTIQQAAREGIQMNFLECDSVKAVLPERDLLFIDSWHIYGHLKRELETHHSTTRKYIVMHDTVVDAFEGESIRLGMDIAKQSAESGYPVEEIQEGLAKAISEFLCDHIHEWQMHKLIYESYGLTVLKRISS